MGDLLIDNPQALPLLVFVTRAKWRPGGGSGEVMPIVSEGSVSSMITGCLRTGRGGDGWRGRGIKTGGILTGGGVRKVKGGVKTGGELEGWGDVKWRYGGEGRD